MSGTLTGAQKEQIRQQKLFAGALIDNGMTISVGETFHTDVIKMVEENARGPSKVIYQHCQECGAFFSHREGKKPKREVFHCEACRSNWCYTCARQKVENSGQDCDGCKNLSSGDRD